MVIICVCEPAFWESIRKMRNKYRKFFINQETITPDQQKRYMAEHNNNYIIAINYPCWPDGAGGKLVGYAGVVDNDIRICVDEDYQHQGLGEKLLEEIKKNWPSATAKIFDWNEGSQKLFTKVGIPFKVIHKVSYNEENNTQSL